MRGLDKIDCALLIVFGLGFGSIDELEGRIASVTVSKRTGGEERCGKMFGKVQWSFSTELRQRFYQATVQKFKPPVRLWVIRRCGDVLNTVLSLVNLHGVSFSLVPPLVISRLGALNLATILDPMKQATVAA